MKCRLIACALAASIAFAVPAGSGAQAGPTAAPAAGSCPATVSVPQLCNAVSDQLGESNPDAPGVRFQYQRLIRRASCVEASDAPTVVQAKIQEFWNRNQARLVCTQLGFSIRNGHILKLAVERDSREFVNDAVRRWKLDLNHVDATGQTVLDYIDAELARQKGSSYEPILQRYFKIFRDHGAKYRRELAPGAS